MNKYLQDDDTQDLNINLLTYRDEDIYDMEQEIDSFPESKQDRYQSPYYDNSDIKSSDLSQSPQKLQIEVKKSEINVIQKQQPFISSIVMKKLKGYLEKDGFSQLKDISQSLNHLLLRGQSKKFKKEVLMQVIRCTLQDCEIIQQRVEKIIGIDTLQFVQKYYNILFYQELFLLVIVQDNFKQTLYQELQEKNNDLSQYQMNQLFFQISHSLTEIHSHKIIHYQITPHNIIKTHDGQYKLTRIEEIITLKNRTILEDSERKYLSPESLKYLNNQSMKFEDLTNKVDVYSLGILFVDLLRVVESKNTSSSPLYNSPFSIKVNSPLKLNLHQTMNSFQEENIDITCSNENNNLNNQINNNKCKEELTQVSNKQIIYIDKLERDLLNANIFQRMNSYEIFNRISHCITLDSTYIQSMLSSIYRSLKVDIFSRNKEQNYLKLLRLNYSELRLSLTLLLPKQQPESILNAYKCASIHNITNTNYAKGLSYAQSSLQIIQAKFDQNRKEMINLLIVISLCHERLKQFNESLDNSNQAYQLVKILEPIDYQLTAKSCCRLSWAYCRLKDGKKAIQYGEESLQNYQKLNQKKFILNIAEVLDAVGCGNELIENYNSAIQRYQKSLDLRLQQMNQNNPIIAQSYYNIGIVLMMSNIQNNSQKAQDYFFKSANIYRQYKGKYVKQLEKSLKQILEILLKTDEQQQIEQIQSELNQIQTLSIV